MSFDFNRFADKTAVIRRGQEYSYGWLSEQIESRRRRLTESGLEPGSVVSLEADFHPQAVALFFALAEHNCIIVPVAPAARSRKNLLDLAQVQYRYYHPEAENDHRGRSGETGMRQQENSGLAELEGPVPAGSPAPGQAAPTHPLYRKLAQLGHPGLVLFSSGTTGAPKAAVHDLQPMLKKFSRPRHPYRSIAFLMFDHIGGINTMLYILSSGGCLVTVPDRRPETVLQAVERHQVELLPASPTFLHMILLSEAYRQYRLDSLQVVSYGTEPMPETTLLRFHQCFPQVRLQQTYGLSEIGIPATRSKASDSLWVSIGGDGVETRVVDHILQIRSPTAMLGYLNAPSPFTEDGWLNTGDAVVTDGRYLRFLGRQDDRINVGGEKVYPVEIENTLLEMEDIAEVSVYGEKNLLTGSMVAADVVLKPGAATGDPADSRRRIREFCAARLARYKVPARINLVRRIPRTERGKKKNANV